MTYVGLPAVGTAIHTNPRQRSRNAYPRLPGGVILALAGLILVMIIDSYRRAPRDTAAMLCPGGHAVSAVLFTSLTALVELPFIPR